MRSLLTDRLVLRPWQRDDAQALFEIRSFPDVAMWLATPEVWTTVERAVQWIEDRLVEADDTLGDFAVVPTEVGKPIGSVSLHRTPDDTEFGVGWYLHPDYFGRGYASEASRALLDHAWAHGVDRVWAIMFPQNDASAKVAAAIGMTDLGVLDDYWYGTVEEPTSRMFRMNNPHSSSST